MGTTILKIGNPSPLLSGERVVQELKSFRLITSKSLPSYRIGWSIPFLWRVSLRITNKSCHATVRILGFMTQEIRMWYPGKNPEGDPETVTGVHSGMGFFGPYLEIRSHSPKRRAWWLWSPDLTLHFYQKEPECLEAAIVKQMGKDQSAAQPNEATLPRPVPEESFPGPCEG
jgi:hypothetical protein